MASNKVGSGGGAGTPGGSEKRPEGGPEVRSTGGAGGLDPVSSAIVSALVGHRMKAGDEALERLPVRVEFFGARDGHEIVDASVFLQHIGVEHLADAVELGAK